MTPSAADVRPGKCFLRVGSKPQVVRVLSVNDGRVGFEARLRRRAWSARSETEVIEFVGGLVKEVGSDFDPSDAGRIHV